MPPGIDLKWSIRTLSIGEKELDPAFKLGKPSPPDSTKSFVAITNDSAAEKETEGPVHDPLDA